MATCNIDNRTIFLQDNLNVLQNINSECIDLIYLDPPFNKNKKFVALIGSSAEGAKFKDIFREDDLIDEWLQTIEEDQPHLNQYLNGVKGVGKAYNFAYLAYMAIRLIECHRILKPNGSIYLHCDPTMSHYLKTTMDCIFGEDKFRCEITWKRTFAHGGTTFGNVADIILFYGPPALRTKELLVPHEESYLSEHFKYEDRLGRFQRITLEAADSADSTAESFLPWEGVDPTTVGRHWAPPLTGLVAEWIEENVIPNYRNIQGVHNRLDALNRHDLIYWPKNKGGKPRLKRHLRADDGKLPTNIWTDIPPLARKDPENTGYPTQKPLALLERVIKASSNKGDRVLDPFCGGATACIAAERLGREWIGIDVSHKAYDLVRERLNREVARPDELFGEEVHLTTRTPVRKDVGSAVGETKHVYIVSHPNFPSEYKVGVAKNVKSRLNAYQTSDPDRAYKLEFSHETHLYRETEKHIHDTFENKHEWVSGEVAEIKREIIEFSEQVYDR